MQPEDTAFKPFEPMFEDPPAAGEPAAKPKRERKPRVPKAAKPKIPPAPRHERPTRKKKKAGKKRAIRTAPVVAPSKARKARAHKVDLDVALLIGAMLKSTDLKVFGDVRDHLRDLNKATRRRVLGAIQKVFE